MKLSQNYSFWFCVGSQSLYGEEVLNNVARHAREMVDTINAQGVLPFPLKLMPTLISGDGIRQMFNDANQDPACAGVITWMHTFSPAKSWIRGLKEYRKPLMHLLTQYNEEIHPPHTLFSDFCTKIRISDLICRILTICLTLCGKVKTC